LLEAEAAKEYGMAYNEEWYSIAVKSREMMIAARTGRQWIEMLQTEDMMRRSK